MSKLIDQLEEVVSALAAARIANALIGGLAVAAHRVVRSTQDVDLLVDGTRADDADAVFARLGYTSIYRTENVANYVRGTQRLDVLYARQARRVAMNQPIADEGFPDFATLPALRGTWQDFVALMELVEQLCPEWPHREPLRGDIFRL